MNALALLVLLAAPAAAETVAITGGTVHTLGAAGTLDHATVLIQDGRIVGVGTELAIPENARRIDASGKVVTPGLIDSLSRIGLVEVSAVAPTRDSAVEDDHISAAFDVTDALNPRSSLFAVSRMEGLTRAAVMPEVGRSLIAGQGALVHLAPEQADWVLRSQAALHVTLGEKGAELAGGSRGGAVLRLREAFQDALDYAAHREAFEEGRRRAYALSRLDLEALQPFVHGERPVMIAVDRASDIETALRLADDFGLRLVLAGAAEGWLLAPRIAAAGVPVLLTVLDNVPHFDRLAATLENAARLHAAGVRIALCTGVAHNGRNLKQAAGIAVAYGLPWEAALAAITREPARVWGLEGYGTLEPGSDADVVVWDGDPLEVTTFADAVFIRGRQIPMTSRQIQLRDRYRHLRTHPALPASTE